MREGAMKEAEMQARIDALEGALVDLWHTSVEPYLQGPLTVQRFIAIDRKIRELGLAEKLKR